MKQLYVEANKSFKHGFVLSEPELRRFNDLIREQIKKINPNPTISSFYILKFQNGVVAETDNIDSDNSLKYNIRSTDRDWVFVTSSQLDERINKIKRSNLSFSKGKTGSRLISPLILLVVTMVMMISLLTSITKREDYLPDIRAKYENGKINSTDELILTLEEAKNQQVKSLELTDVFYLPGIVLGGLIIMLIVFYIYTWKLYPIYNFCWGEYLEIFKKKETNRKTFNTVVIIGLLVSIIGGIIANYLNVKI